MKRLLLLCLLLTGCAPAPFVSAPALSATVTPTPFQPAGSIESPAGFPLQSPFAPDPRPGPTPTTSNPPPASLWLGAEIPSGLRDQAAGWGLPAALAAESATVRLTLTAGDESPSVFWIFALVAAFPTVLEEASSQDLRALWRGAPAGALEGRRLAVRAETYRLFSAWWGEPDAQRVGVWDGDWAEVLWGDRALLALVEFGELQPRLKVLRVDGQSPLQNDFDAAAYPLRAPFTLTCAADCPPLPASNRDPSRLTVLIMTGVTALVRATAYKMETNGVLYPGRDVRELLRAADVLHISNEVPFAVNCPFPDPNQESLVFCSDPRYIALLEDIGADLIELTGNHFQDRGSEATLFTLDLYDARGWGHFGGGRDLESAMRPALVEHHGNRIAFVGCNPVGPDFAWATETRPGAAPCGDYLWMKTKITRLRDEGWLPVATLQYHEYYYAVPAAKQREDFRALAGAGAVIVSGSQAHFPQSMEFYGESFIHYGLGNLFFDQMDIPVVGTRRGFVDRYVFYDNRLIGIELIPTLLEDYARPRPMETWERGSFLQEYFAYSGW